MFGCLCIHLMIVPGVLLVLLASFQPLLPNNHGPDEKPDPCEIGTEEILSLGSQAVKREPF
jgi:hypothetical protein